MSAQVDDVYVRNFGWCEQCAENYCINCAENDPELKEPNRFCTSICEKDAENEDQ
jgi:hypothetical protein